MTTHYDNPKEKNNCTEKIQYNLLDLLMIPKYCGSVEVRIASIRQASHNWTNRSVTSHSKQAACITNKESIIFLANNQILTEYYLEKVAGDFNLRKLECIVRPVTGMTGTAMHAGYVIRERRVGL